MGLNFSIWVDTTETLQDYSHFVFTNVFKNLLCARLRAVSETGESNLNRTQPVHPPRPSSSSLVWLAGSLLQSPCSQGLSLPTCKTENPGAMEAVAQIKDCWCLHQRELVNTLETEAFSDGEEQSTRAPRDHLHHSQLYRKVN